MTEDSAADKAPFNLDRLRELIALMEQHGLTEVSLKQGDEHWKLRRGPPEGVPFVTSGAYPLVPVVAGGSLSNVGAGSEQSSAGPTTPAVDDGTVLIKSPTVGTFYAAPSPDDPPFITVGSPVLPDTIVCIVEAMKVFNQIPAEISGTVVAVLINTGDSVEFGQPLFRVRPG